MTGSDQSRSPAEHAGRAERIRLLNDQFRATFIGGMVMLTEGIQNFASTCLPYLLEKVRSFDQFSASNDPYAEHDFGAFEWDRETVFWKIDYYDADLLACSPDPTEPAVTTRVLTIMLAWEY